MRANLLERRQVEPNATIIIPLHDRVIFVSLLNDAEFSRRPLLFRRSNPLGADSSKEGFACVLCEVELPIGEPSQTSIGGGVSHAGFQLTRPLKC